MGAAVRQPPRPQQRARARGRRRSPSRRSSSSRTPPRRPPDRSAAVSSVTGTSTPASPAIRLLMIIADADHDRQIAVAEDRDTAPSPISSAERRRRWRARCGIRAGSCGAVFDLVSWLVASARTTTASVCVPALPPIPETIGISTASSAKRGDRRPGTARRSTPPCIAVPRLTTSQRQPRADGRADRLVDVAVARARQPQRCPRRLPPG